MRARVLYPPQSTLVSLQPICTKASQESSISFSYVATFLTPFVEDLPVHFVKPRASLCILSLKVPWHLCGPGHPRRVLNLVGRWLTCTCRKMIGLIFLCVVPRSLGAYRTTTRRHARSRAGQTTLGMGRRTGRKYLATDDTISCHNAWRIFVQYWIYQVSIPIN